VKHVIKELYKRGTKRLCKVLLRSHKLDVVDTDILHEFERVLVDAGLSADVETIEDNDDDDSSSVQLFLLYISISTCKIVVSIVLISHHLYRLSPLLIL
jgi:hypothetical protein